jgi:hypothetical protein
VSHLGRSKGKNHGHAHYGCPLNAFRGTCSNKLRIRKDILETQLLAKLQNEILRDDVIEYALNKFEEGLKKRMKDVSGQLSRMEIRKRKLEKELTNLTKAVATGLDSPSIRAEIVNREREIQAINEQVISSKPESVKTKINDTRKFVMSSFKDIRSLLASNPQTAKSVLARHMPQIIMKPIVKPDGQKVYQVVSEWELLEGGLMLGAKGDERSSASPLACAEGQS